MIPGGPSGVVGWMATSGGWVLLGIGALMLLGLPLLQLVGHVGQRVRRALRGGMARRGGAGSVESELDRRLALLGERWGQPRNAAETTAAHASAVSAATGIAEIAEVGVLVDRSRFGAVPPTAHEVASAVAVLERAEGRTVIPNGEAVDIR